MCGREERRDGRIGGNYIGKVLTVEWTVVSEWVRTCSLK